MGTYYVHRKTGKTGRFVRQDDEKHVVYLENEDGEFSVAASQFKSFWRELSMDEEEVVEFGTAKEVEEKEEDPQVDFDSLNDDLKITVLKGWMSEKRDVKFAETEKEFRIYVEDIIVFVADKSDDGYILYMLPDIYTYSDLPDGNFFNFKIIEKAKDKLTVRLEVKYKLSYILQMIEKSVEEINLYGYKD